MSRHDLPIVSLDSEQADQPGDCWDMCMAFVQRVLEVVGAVFLVIALFIGAGYWWGRWEVRVIKAQAEAIDAKQPTCGSCRLGDGK